MSERREPPIQFRDDDLAAELDHRGDNRNQVARRDLARYYALMRRETDRIGLAPAEWNLLRDALSGSAWHAGTEHSASLLALEIADAIRLDGLAAKWAVDGAALVARLGALSAGETLAVVDAVERWWQRQR